MEEETDESLYWLEVLVDSHIVTANSTGRLLDEGNQLLKIVVASINTARGGSR